MTRIVVFAMNVQVTRTSLTTIEMAGKKTDDVEIGAMVVAMEYSSIFHAHF